MKTSVMTLLPFSTHKRRITQSFSNTQNSTAWSSPENTALSMPTQQGLTLLLFSIRLFLKTNTPKSTTISRYRTCPLLSLTTIMCIHSISPAFLWEVPAHISSQISLLLKASCNLSVSAWRCPKPDLAQFLKTQQLLSKHIALR